MILGVERSGINGGGFWVELGFLSWSINSIKQYFIQEHAWKLFQVQGSL
jgi:hypothetical protein